MVSNGKAKFMNANINKTNTVSNGEIRMRGRSMPVEVSNDDGTKTTFTSVNRAVKALGKSNAAQIHLMIANGKARFVDTSEEEKKILMLWKKKRNVTMLWNHQKKNITMSWNHQRRTDSQKNFTK